jgi:hypothetical protein
MSTRQTHDLPARLEKLNDRYINDFVLPLTRVFAHTLLVFFPDRDSAGFSARDFFHSQPKGQL